MGILFKPRDSTEKKPETKLMSASRHRGVYDVKLPPTPKQEEKDYKVIVDEISLIAYFDRCISTGYFSFDFETTASKRTRNTHGKDEILHHQRLKDIEEDRDIKIRNITDQHGEGKKAELTKLLKRAESVAKKEIVVEMKRFKAVKEAFLKSPLDPHKNDICTLSISAKPHEARVIFLQGGGGPYEYKGSHDILFDRLRAIMEVENLVKIAYNLTFETKCLLKHKIYLKGRIADPMIMIVRCMQVVYPDMIELQKRPSAGKSLKAMTKEFLGHSMTPFEDVINSGEAQFFDDLSTDDPRAVNYSAEDADYSLQLYLYWKEVADLIPVDDGPHNTYYEWLEHIEMPFMRVIGQMEYHGMMFNNITAEETSEEAVEKMEEATESIADISEKVMGERLDCGKTGKNGAMRNLIFEVMELPKAAVSDKTGDPSLDYGSIMDIIFMLENDMTSLDDELADYNDRYREHVVHPFKEEGIKLMKTIKDVQKYGVLLSSHIEGRRKFVHPVTGRIHSNYTVWTETSRTNSSKPNGQNIPRPDNDIFGIRNLYQAPKGKVLIPIDYAGFELRLMAWKANEATMLDLFSKDGDLHNATACTMTGKEPNDITKSERSSAKAGNFGCNYGGTEWALQKTFKKMDIRKSLVECREIVDAVLNTYPRIKEFQKESGDLATVRRFSDTIFGYKRYLHDIRSYEDKYKRAARRQAVNTHIQGSAADVMKWAQNRVYDYISDNDYHGKVDMIAQIHDELILEVDYDLNLIDKVVKDVVAIMETEPLEDFPIKLVAEPEITEKGLGDKQCYYKWRKNL